MFLNPSMVHVELSSRCVLKCPRCPRTELNLDYLNQEIPFNTFVKAFDIDVLPLIKTFVFCGHTGDPIYAKSILPVIEYVKTHSTSQIIIVTNGSYKEPNFWLKLGSLLSKKDCVTFSVDGWDDESNKKYRINSNFDSIISAIGTLKQNSFVNLKLSTILFKFNQDNIEKIKMLAQSLGIDFFEVVQSTKFRNHYLINGVDELEPTVGFLDSNKSMYKKHVSNLTGKLFQVSKLKSNNKHPWALCANHLKEIFVDVRGYVLPCPWIADGYHINTWVDENKNLLDINHRSFLEILLDDKLWQSLAQTWEKQPMFICDYKCKQNE